MNRCTGAPLAIASGRFVAAGVLRLAQWRLVHDAPNALVRAVLTKLGVGSQLEAVAMAHRSGWLSRR